MNIEYGIVKAREGTDVLIEAEGGDGCAECALGHTCSMGGKARTRLLRMYNGIGAREGDRVEFSLRERTLFFASFFLYLFPVLMLLGGAALGSSYGPDGLDRDLSAALFGFLGFLLSLGIIRQVSKRLDRTRTLVPVLTAVVPGEGGKPK